ncbi:acetate--CoA ligase family protein [Aeromicrobium sp. UC242_57]|uniref:acetate--CoA ligase family protein n=1 Tax=Aeromicrobium sp. UC242_57 TaxID=3374624 RepID=UPI0037938276
MGNVSRAQGTDLLDLLEEVGNSSSNVLVAHSHYPEIVTDLASRGVRSTDDPEAALEMVAVMSRFETRRQEILSEDHEVLTASRLSAMADDTHVASSSEARALLEKAGVRFPSEFAVIDEDEAALCWGKIGGPVALKIDADWMPHKTEHGGLILGLNTESDVRVAFERLRSIAQTLAPDGATTAFVVQEMIPPGIELICGGLRNPLFGPIISVGVGGVLTEIIQLRGLTLAPVSSAEARRLLCRLADGRLVQSVRGLDESQIEAVVEAIVGLGDLLSAHDDIAEIEVNPLIVTASGVVAVDALVSLASTG